MTYLNACDVVLDVEEMVKHHNLPRQIVATRHPYCQVILVVSGEFSGGHGIAKVTHVVLLGSFGSCQRFLLVQEILVVHLT